MKFTLRQLAIITIIAGTVVATSIALALAWVVAEGVDADWEPWDEGIDWDDLDWMDAEMGEWMDPT